MSVSHLSLFYETRQSVQVDDTNPGNNPHTDLRRPPEVAKITFDNHPDRLIDSEQFDAPDGKGYEVAQFLIQRAMLDPDATVIPMS